jgi:hypothetical protein
MYQLMLRTLNVERGAALKSLQYGKTRSLALTYNTRMQPATFTVPNVLSKTYDYQPDGRLVFSHDLTNPKFDRSYEYDHAGRITQALSGGEARNEGFTALQPYKQTFSQRSAGPSGRAAGEYCLVAERRKLLAWASDLSE